MGQARLSLIDHSKEWPSFLKKASDNQLLDTGLDHPILVNMASAGSEKQLAGIIKNSLVTEIVDNYDEQVGELFIGENAHLYKENLDVKRSSIRDHLKEHYGKIESWKKGVWVYYPWSGQLCHVLEEELFWELRTLRNKNLITEEEQKNYKELNCGCLGMSVGSSGALALVLQGGSQNIKLVDGAVISGSNLNRILTGVGSVGKEKSLVIAQQILEMNPFTNVLRGTEKINKNNLNNFFDKTFKLGLVIDEIDDLEMKIRVRLGARERGIPVVMATELGDQVMLDVERFDLNRNLPLFHGIVPNIEEILENTNVSQRKWMKYATDIIGIKNVPIKMQKSLLQVGSTIPTHPQLGGTSMFAGAANAYAARLIANNQPLKSGRNIISFDKEFLEGHTGWANKSAHRKHTKVMKNALGAMTKE